MFEAYYSQLNTPCLVVDEPMTRENIKRMQQVADANGCTLRPHIKTHKMPYFAKLQQQLGAFQHPVFTACFSPSSERLLVSGALSSFLIYRREGDAWKVEADTTVVNEWEKNHHGLLQLNMNRGGVATR